MTGRKGETVAQRDARMKVIHAKIDKARVDYETNGLRGGALLAKYEVTEAQVATRKRKDASLGNPWVLGGTTNVTVQDEHGSSKLVAKNIANKLGRAREDTTFYNAGLFSKYLSPDALELYEAMEFMTAADILWGQIKIMYTNFIRAQEIMYVANKHDDKRDMIGSSSGGAGESETWQIDAALDRHAKAITAQASAANTLRAHINAFVKLADEADERRLKLEGMNLNLDKLKLEIAALQRGDTLDNSIQINVVNKTTE